MAAAYLQDISLVSVTIRCTSGQRNSVVASPLAPRPAAARASLRSSHLKEYPMTESLTILIVDDHPLFRKGIRALLSTLSQVQVVGEAASGNEAVRLVAQLQPRLVLLD